jgi:5-enolpyruvylshikimate-3-phosphate synthase
MKEKGLPARSGSGKPGGAAEALIALDRDLMKLLVRRAVLVSRIREGKNHASSPAAVQAEKAVRIAFEANASAFSKDPRFTGKFFSLLQDLALLSREEAEKKPGFVLSPPRKPVRVLLAGPASSRAARMWMALAAMSGAPAVMPGLPLSEAVLTCAKALNQAGGVLEWLSGSDASVTLAVAGKSIPSFAGKTLFLGEDALTLYLVCFMAVHKPGILRLTGGPELKEAELAGLRHILPSLGARLAHVIPHSQGLPASLECSGILPDNLVLPAELPLEGVCALLLAPLVWGRPMTFNLSLLPAAVATTALTELSALFAACGAEVESRGPCLIYSAMPPRIPEYPRLPLDPVLSAYLLALAAFAGGSISLNGIWPAYLPEAQEALRILRWAGLRVEVGEDALTAVPDSSFGLLPPEEPEAALLPLVAAVFARDIRRNRGPLPPIPEGDPAIRSFFACLGISTDSPGPPRHAGGKQDSAAGRDHSVPAWICPDACWGLALALASFIRPGVRLANPDIVTRTMPSFWPLFNSLPEPGSPGDAAPLPPVGEKPPRSSHRRIRME